MSVEKILLQIDEYFSDEIEKEQFVEQYFSQNTNIDLVWTHPQFKLERPGTQDVLSFPDTKIHRERNPELYNFVFSHFPCYISRGSFGTWCGYVEIGSSRPVWENGEEENFSVHGGITLDSRKIGIIGFDLNHYGDIGPFERYNNLKYRDREYVISELKKLSEQVFNKLPSWSPKTHFIFPKSLRKYVWEIYKIWYLRKGTILSYIVEKDIWINIISLSIGNHLTSSGMKIS